MKKKNKEEIEELVMVFLCDYFGMERDEIKPESKMATDLRADSLDMVELMLYAERTFGIEISDDKLDAMANCTVSEIVDMIGELQGLS